MVTQFRVEGLRIEELGLRVCESDVQIALVARERGLVATVRLHSTYSFFRDGRVQSAMARGLPATTRLCLTDGHIDMQWTLPGIEKVWTFLDVFVSHT